MLTIPPQGYGGIERVVSLLTEGLVERGHEVTLFASGDSRTSAVLSSVVDKAPGWNGTDLHGTEIYHETAAFLRAGEFDVVSDHSWFGACLAALGASPTPVVTTMHLPWVDDTRQVHRLAGNRIHRVAISEHQRRGNTEVDWAATISNGIDLQIHPYRDDKEDFLVFLGRTADEKGPEQAVEVAKRSGRHLKMLVKREEPEEREHWERCVAPVLSGDEDIIDSPSHEQKVDVLGRAAGLLFPIQWAEPFGLVMAEAMACGTPVIGLAKGAVPEVVEDGVTGFVVSSLDEMVDAVPRLKELSPTACRERTARLFSAQTMTARYAELFTSLSWKSPA
ncbi:glycosyltransferase family 4 protein [Streptomyces scopuliridis]|uniref:Glycosyltransferase family 4 protein n=1 Tax=Streptomyces scopuliridis TaxID=452529 RepID=A0ACD4ZWH4_9ACTN|nr:glycosyltransferase family 4 protein [Streptomyces scopuliridis]WSC02873.1 glycosyltransferase family 4 protein [Streptomyces scopuliridis]WSC11255.1 glycosyltransferase family 4 protein [Streptomyces scopuliridis]